MVDVAGVSVPLSVLVPVTMAVLVSILLWAVDAEVSKGVVVSLTPWMVVGAAGHTLYTTGTYDPGSMGIFFGPVGAYFTTFTIAGMVWAMSGVAGKLSEGSVSAPQYLASAGTGAAIVVGAGVLSGSPADLSRIYPTFGGLVGTLIVASLGYFLLNFVYPKALIKTGTLGFLVVFGHSMDAVMTAIDVELFGNTASYPAAREILAVAAGLPTASSIGVGWLLVVAKIVLALVLVSIGGYLLGRDDVRDYPAPVYLALGLVGVWGLGPALHHFFVMLL